jgi:hypothetical protein
LTKVVKERSSVLILSVSVVRERHMKYFKVMYLTLWVKTSLFLTLFFSIFFIFPQFLWRSDIQERDIDDAIRSKKSLEECNDKGATPLIGAASEGRTDLVNKLLDAGAKINAHAKNPDDQLIEAGNTALHYACLNGDSEVVKLLVKRGADPLALNDNKNTALYVLINNVALPLSTKEECIRALVGTDPQKIRAQFDAQNKQGYTVLMRAIELRSADVVALLLKNWGSFMNYGLKNANGNSAYSLALSDGADDSIIGMVKEAQERWMSARK